MAAEDMHSIVMVRQTIWSLPSQFQPGIANQLSWCSAGLINDARKGKVIESASFR